MRRLVVLFLLLPMWVHGGCQSKQEPDSPRVAVAALRPKANTAPRPTFPRNYNNTASMTAFYEESAMQEKEHPEIRKASNFIANPFMPAPEPSLQHYIAQIKTRCALQKDPIVNTHNARYVDTLFQLSFDSSTVELYYPLYSKRFLLSFADVKSDNLPLVNGIKVGTSRQELLQKLQEYKLFIKEEKNMIEVCDFERNSWLRFQITKDRVSNIQYEGYVD